MKKIKVKRSKGTEVWGFAIACHHRLARLLISMVFLPVKTLRFIRPNTSTFETTNFYTFFIQHSWQEHWSWRNGKTYITSYGPQRKECTLQRMRQAKTKINLAPAQSDPSLRRPLKDSINLQIANDYLQTAKWGLWSDCADAQSDLSHLAHVMWYLLFTLRFINRYLKCETHILTTVFPDIRC